jgi:hypothetical protein
MNLSTNSIILGDDLINKLRAYCVTFRTRIVSLDVYNESIDFVLTGLLNSTDTGSRDQAQKLTRLKLLHGFQMPDHSLSALMGHA